MLITIILLLSLAVTALSITCFQMHRARSTSYISVTKHEAILKSLKDERDAFKTQLMECHSKSDLLYSELTAKAIALADLRFEAWKTKEEKVIRADALKRSENTTKGKITEHMAPFTTSFKYNPRDCKFLGMPLDYIVFDGLEQNLVNEIVFLEIKTGEHAKLTQRERSIRDAVKAGKIRWETLNL